MDSKEVKQRASGHWREIVSRTSGVSIDLLDRKHHGCPKCGGSDRFRALDDFDRTGGVICNQCFTKQTGNHCDGFSTVQWLTGKSFPDVIRDVMQFLGIQETPKPKTEKPKGVNYGAIQWEPLEPNRVGLFLLKKQPITFEAIQAVGGRFAIYQRKFPVIMVPVWGEFLTAADPCGWVMYEANGGPLYMKDGTELKMKTLTGSVGGVILNTRAIKTLNDLPLRSIKVEGPTDLLALISKSIDLPAWTNSNGAGESVKDFNRRMVAGAELSIIHDADEPGQKGLEHWSTELAKSATLVRKLRLPYTTEPSHGKDLRDWLNEGNGPAQFKQLIANAEIVEGAGKHDPEESEDIFDVEDPDRLARINLDKYEQSIGGRVAYYKGALYRWTHQKPYYTELPTDEFIAKARKVIRTEFIAEQQSTSRKRVRPITNTLMNNLVKATESQSLVSHSKTMPFWLSDSHQLSGRHCLSCKNGLIDLDTLIDKGIPANLPPGELPEYVHPHSPDWFSMSNVPAAYEPNSQCRKWINFLLKAMEGDIERISLLQEWFGYLLLGDARFQKCLLLVGDGKNGKSVLLAAMRAMLGKANYSSLSIEDLAKDFELANTIGKLANITADMNEVDQVAEGVIKAMASGDPIHVKVKYKAGVTMVPTARLVFATNNLPRISDRSQGTWRRLTLIPFNYIVTPEERVYGMDTEEFWQDELNGIFNWSLGGLYRLCKQNHFTYSKVCDQSLREYRSDSNPLDEFFENTLEPEAEAIVELEKVYKLYRTWCVQSGYNSMGVKKFGKEVERHFKRVEGFKRTRLVQGRLRKSAFAGVRFVSTDFFEDKKPEEDLFDGQR